MQHHFYVSGIKCQSCVKKISDLLQQDLQATDIKILDNKELAFDASEQIHLDRLNMLLKQVGDYSVSEYKKSEAISYKPIYIIFAYLILGSVFAGAGYFSIHIFMAHFMAGFFLVFSFFKMLDLSGFATGYASYDVIAKKFYRYGYVYPFIELGFGIAYLLFPYHFLLNAVVFVVMSISTVGVVSAKFSKRQFQCACVGTFLKVPLGNIAIIEDLSMVVMSFLMMAV